MSVEVRLRHDTSGWSALSIEHLDSRSRQKILARQAAVEDYFHYVPLKTIANMHGLLPSEVHRLAHRCMESDEDGNCYEWRGILIREVLRPYQRRSPINDGHAQRGRGLSCAFSDLLDRKPEIAEALREALNPVHSKRKVREFKYSLKSLFRLFRTLCANAGLRRDEYPLMTKLQGYRSLGEFVRQEMARGFESSVKVRYGQIAASHMKVGTGHISRRATARPFDALQLDGFDLPMIGCVLVPTSKGLREVAANRIWLCPIVDVELRAILGYSASVKDLSESDILDAFVHMRTPWTPRDLSGTGLKYPAGAGFPSGLSPLFTQCGFSSLFIDNAEIHLNKAVQERIRRRFGCAINNGPAYRWDRRSLIERVGGRLMQEGFARIPSSMGSGPKDPHRKDPVGIACRKRILLDRLFDFIDVELAAFNAMNSEGLYNISPLRYAQQFLDDRTMLWPVLPALPEAIPDLDTDVLELPFAGDASEGRRPYIQYKRVRYTNEIIAASPNLYGTYGVIHIRRDDLRTIKVFAKKSGLSLGTARALGGWDRTRHSLQTRNLVNSLKDDRILQLTADTDPVVQLVDHLSGQVRRNAERANHKVSAAASLLARVTRESGLSASGPTAAPTYQPLTLREELARKRGRRNEP